MQKIKGLSKIPLTKKKFFEKRKYKMIEAVIFDLDGTLLNTLEDLTDSCNAALKKFNFPERSIEEVRGFVGNGLEKLMERAIPLGKENPQFSECFAQLKSEYAKNWQNKTKAYDGVLDALNELNSRGIKTGIVSNKPDEQVKELASLYFSAYINPQTAVGERPGIKRKPAPDSLNEVIKILGVNKSAVVYAGDSDVDIETARAAGIRCISVSWGFRSKEFLQEHNATLIVSNTKELLDVILNEKI